MSKPLLEVKGLKKYFFLNKDMLGRPRMTLRAVDNVSFRLEAGKTIGVVGESGCGKTTLGRTVLQLYDTTGGKSLYYGHTLDEFAPDYYLKALIKLDSNMNKANNILLSLAEYQGNPLFDDYRAYLEPNQNLLISDYEVAKNELLAKLNGLAKEEHENHRAIKAVANKLNEVHSLYLESANTCGALAFADRERVKHLLQEKSKLLSKAFREMEPINEDELNPILDEIKTLQATVAKTRLAQDFDNNLELGLDLAKLNKKEMRSLRTEIQLIFQDPYSSLPPRMTVGSILSEAVKVHHIVPKDKLNQYIHTVMDKCGLQPQYYDRYPHEFSGGQRQRICIARALAVNPKLVICDEPVSALDVSIQAQIINLLKELQRDLGLTYIFISHDLSVVKYITDNILVMYLGNMMETGKTEDIFKNPLHPYTQALFSAVPNPDPDSKMQRITLEGDIPSPANPPKGCKFHTRCAKCMNVCKMYAPKHIEFEDNHVVACHLYDKEIMANLEKYDLEYEAMMEREAELLQEKNSETKLDKLKAMLKIKK